MLPPAATLHVHAGQFQGLLEAMEAFACLAVLGKTGGVEISCLRC